jgi:hypothetical protein
MPVAVQATAASEEECCAAGTIHLFRMTGKVPEGGPCAPVRIGYRQNPSVRRATRRLDRLVGEREQPSVMPREFVAMLAIGRNFARACGWFFRAEENDQIMTRKA